MDAQQEVHARVKLLERLGRLDADRTKIMETAVQVLKIRTNLEKMKKSVRNKKNI